MGRIDAKDIAKNKEPDDGVREEFTDTVEWLVNRANKEMGEEQFQRFLQGVESLVGKRLSVIFENRMKKLFNESDRLASERAELTGVSS